MQKEIIVPASSGETRVVIDVTDPIVSVTQIPVEAPNKPPTVSDASPVSITLPINEAVISAQASDPDGTIEIVKWEQVTGPSAAIIADNSLLTTKATGLQAGTYSFKVTVTDNKGATDDSIRTIVVNPAPPPPTNKVFPIISAPVDKEYSRPFAGGIYWNGVGWDGSNALKLVESQDTYQRFNWFDFEDKVEGQYNWSLLDKLIDAAAAKGQKFYHGGIMPVCSSCSAKRQIDGAEYGFPEWLYRKMAADTNAIMRPWKAVDSSYPTTWVPNWNSEIYLKAWENVNIATYKHLQDTGRLKYVSCMDIRGFGNYGEWHVFPWYWHQPKGTAATSATLKRIVDAVINAVSDIPLVIISAAYDPGNASMMPADFIDYALKAKNNWGNVGWRRDNWGAKGSDNHLVNNPGSFNGVAFKNIILEKWKTSIVTGEPTADFSETGEYTDLMREINLYHPSNIGNGNYSQVPPSSVSKSNLTNGYNATGYRINISKGAVTFDGNKLNINIDWTNTGISPVIENYETWLEIGSWKAKSVFNPKFLLPGLIRNSSDDFVNPNLPAGTYDLKISLVDPTGVRKAGLPLNSVISCKITL